MTPKHSNKLLQMCITLKKHRTLENVDTVVQKYYNNCVNKLLTNK